MTVEGDINAARVVELEPIKIRSPGTVDVAEGAAGTSSPSLEKTDDDANTTTTIRVFELHCDGVAVQVCSLGASITQFRVPRNPHGDSRQDQDTTNSDDNTNCDDIVLGYQSIADMYASQNPQYLGVIVGRVANRIAHGKLELPAHSNHKDDTSETHQLHINNGPNHLHGGQVGFSRQIWEAPDTMESSTSSNAAIEFTLDSPDGDDGYPGAVRSRARYELTRGHSRKDDDDDDKNQQQPSSAAVQLTLTMMAELLTTATSSDDINNVNQKTVTPINLAQHSYFNLAPTAPKNDSNNAHTNDDGILQHKLHLHGCQGYTPVDQHAIPTRHVVYFDNQPDTNSDTDDIMQRVTQEPPILLRDALQQYGVQQAQLSDTLVAQALAERNYTVLDATNQQPTTLPPFGLDHNFVIRQPEQAENSNPPELDSTVLHPVATLSHDATQRRLTVSTTAPGVQVYTANFLENDEKSSFKHTYAPWQGICLETQHYPDSIHVDAAQYADFAQGRCLLLTADQPNYRHVVQYELEFNPNDNKSDNATSISTPPTSTAGWVGRDTEGGRYASVDEMWESQLGDNSSNRDNWYQRGAQYYEDECDATLDGVLGGFAPLSPLDLQASRQFCEVLQQQYGKVMRNTNDSTKHYACEMGAGIGRVTKGLLMPLQIFDQVDLVEPCQHLLNAAPDYIYGDPDDDVVGSSSTTCRYYCSTLQEWQPPERYSYTLIWIQWVFCYLTDTDAIAFLKQCREALEPKGGVIVLKENSCDNDGDDFVLDLDDASVTRSIRYVMYLADQAGLELVHMDQKQDDLPTDNFPVPTIALAPKGAAQSADKPNDTTASTNISEPVPGSGLPSHSSPVAQAFFAALDSGKDQGGTGKPKSKFIQKQLNTLGWRNRFSQDEQYPVSLKTGAEKSDTVEFSVKQVQRGEVEGTYGTGATVWPASMVLIKYMERHAARLLHGKRVVDLGAGTGVTSIAAACCGAQRVICTDGEEPVVGLARENVAASAQALANLSTTTTSTQQDDTNDASNSPFQIADCQIFVEKYWWGTGSVTGGNENCDTVLVSDCVLPKLYPIAPLVDALDQFLVQPEAVAVISYEHRYYPEYDPRDKFRELAHAKALEVETVPAEEQDEVYSTDDIEIWLVRRRATSS